MGALCDSPGEDIRPEGPPTQKKLVFGYWAMRGGTRGNGARYLLNYCGADYTEKTYNMDGVEWQQDKPNLMPFCNLPYIIDGNVKISETLAVHQYIASKYKPELLGRTP